MLPPQLVKIVRETRKRKGLPDVIPPLDHFMDKL